MYDINQSENIINNSDDLISGGDKKTIAEWMNNEILYKEILEKHLNSQYPAPSDITDISNYVKECMKRHSDREGEIAKDIFIAILDMYIVDTVRIFNVKKDTLVEDNLEEANMLYDLIRRLIQYKQFHLVKKCYDIILTKRKIFELIEANDDQELGYNNIVGIPKYTLLKETFKGIDYLTIKIECIYLNYVDGCLYIRAPFSLELAPKNNSNDSINREEKVVKKANEAFSLIHTTTTESVFGYEDFCPSYLCGSGNKEQNGCMKSHRCIMFVLCKNKDWDENYYPDSKETFKKLISIILFGHSMTKNKKQCTQGLNNICGKDFVFYFNYWEKKDDNSDTSIRAIFDCGNDNFSVEKDGKGIRLNRDCKLSLENKYNSCRQLYAFSADEDEENYYIINYDKNLSALYDNILISESVVVDQNFNEFSDK